MARPDDELDGAGVDGAGVDDAGVDNADDHDGSRGDASGESRRGGISWLIRKAWWLHSFGALTFGIGVMLFARKGLSYADELLMVLGISWLLMFVALRFIVGPSNRRPDEPLARKGVRVVTNYVIKNLYQQMFFFLVPMYASSATWSLASPNWWLAPVLLGFAVVSTMDLVFDNFVMERRVLASAMYGIALFGVLNLMLPVVLHMGHFPALLIAAGVAAPAVALLSFRLRAVFSPRGLVTTLAVSAGLVAGAWYGRALVPAAPIVMTDGAVGHGTLSSYECLPGEKRVMRPNQLDGLRCGTAVTEPGGLRDVLVHVWKHDGEVIHRVEDPERIDGCSDVYRSYVPVDKLPEDPTGSWSCVVETHDRQLIGMLHFDVVPAPPRKPGPGQTPASAPPDAPADAPPDAPRTP